MIWLGEHEEKHLETERIGERFGLDRITSGSPSKYSLDFQTEIVYIY